MVSQQCQCLSTGLKPGVNEKTFEAKRRGGGCEGEWNRVSADFENEIERIEQYLPGLPYLGLPFHMNAGYGEGAVFRPLGNTVRRARLCKVSSSGRIGRDGQYLLSKGARAEEAQKEVKSWLRKIEVRQW